MPPVTNQQHRDQQDGDGGAKTEIESHEAAEAVCQPVVSAPLADEAQELDGRSDLAGPTDQAVGQDVHREVGAYYRLGRETVFSLRRLRWQVGVQNVQGPSGEGE